MEPKRISNENKFKGVLQDASNVQACTGRRSKVEQEISKNESVPQEEIVLPTYLPDGYRQISNEPENTKRRRVVHTRNNETKTSKASKNDNEPKRRKRMSAKATKILLQTTENRSNLGKQYSLNVTDDDDDDVDGYSNVDLARARYVRNQRLMAEIFTEDLPTQVASNPPSISSHLISAQLEHKKCLVEIEQMVENFDNEIKLMNETIKRFEESMQLYSKPAVDDETYQKMADTFYHKLKRDEQK